MRGDFFMLMFKKLADNKAFRLALVWLVVVNILAIFANNRFNLKPDAAYGWMDPAKYDQQQAWDIVAIHARWDSNWYKYVANAGYEIKPGETLANVVFFPLYPALMRSLGFFLGGDVLLAGWIWSSLFLVLACLLLYRFVKEFHPEADPLLAVFLLLIFPTAFFLNAVYTESLFLFLSLATFYFGFKRRYLWAGIFGILAALTRVTGILLFLPLVIQALSVEKFDWPKLKKAWPLALIPLGTLLFFAFHWLRFGDPLLFFRIEGAWGRTFSFNPDHFSLGTHTSLVNTFLDASYLLFGLAIILWLGRLRKYPYLVYMASTIGVAVSTGTLMSIGRYILVLFPIYIIGASLKNEIGRYAWILVSAMLMALNTFLFVNWYWAG